jgi:uncharacterized Zn finger protein
MSFRSWKPYVPVAKRRAQAAKTLAKMQKSNGNVSPVIIQGRAIASSFWGKSWCDNLERYSDYANRLPRGRTYARNGSILDLQIVKGEITAKVSGSELYTINISIGAVAAARWKSICGDCAGSIASVVELLQGRLAKGVMDRVCQQSEGLFPGPKDIKLSCSCPDWADMCKHVAATLYGVGARLDAQPELLFVLRGVDAKDMIAGAGGLFAKPKRAPATAKVLAEDDVAALFGLDMAGEGDTAASPIAASIAATKEVRPQRAPARDKPQVAARGKAPKSNAMTTISAKPRASKSASLAAGKTTRKKARQGAAPRTIARKKTGRGQSAMT